MNNEKYNQIIDEAYRSFNKETFTKNSDLPIIFATDSVSMKDRFINKCKTNPEFSEKWGLKIEERELTLEERYNIWFNNNYETGMERYFDPNNLPDFDNEYYEPTPTKSITVTYNNIKTEIYE